MKSRRWEEKHPAKVREINRRALKRWRAKPQNRAKDAAYRTAHRRQIRRYQRHYRDLMHDFRVLASREYRARPDVQKRYRIKGRVQRRERRRQAQACPIVFLKLNVLESIRMRRARGIVVKIDYAYLVRLYQRQRGLCKLSGIPMLAKLRSPRAISADRIDSKKGYVPGNVQLVCRFCNFGKLNFRNAEIRSLIADIRAAGGRRSKAS